MANNIQFLFVASLLATPTHGVSDETTVCSSGMEAAVEALIRIRQEVVATLDRQVGELQQIHRALASAPPRMVVTEDVQQKAAFVSVTTGRLARTFFDHAPEFGVGSFDGVDKGDRRSETTAHPEIYRTASPPPTETPFINAPLDPMLEKATLEELNDALASAFALVSSRGGR